MLRRKKIRSAISVWNFLKRRKVAALLLLGCGWFGWEFSVRSAETKISFKPEERNYWAFQKIKRPAIPKIKSAWVQNPIDAFVLAELKTHKIELSPRADKITLLRRATLDLIGVPPTPPEVESFLADQSASAFSKVVDRLLASPHYGEVWGRHWLDLARYAESEGFKSDETRPNAWRYRDYVIKSFNADKPYDRFVREQIAGDELWPNDSDALIATAFNRHYPDESNARNLRQRRQEILNDITDTVGAVFTGMTFGCARCHNHKFDPILQADYYRLQAFFANTAAFDEIPLAKPDAKKLAIWEEKTKAIRDEIDRLEAPERKKLLDEYLHKYPDEVKIALNKSAEQRTPLEKQFVQQAQHFIDPKSHQFLAASGIVVHRLKGDARQRWDELHQQLDQFKNLNPGEIPVATGMADLGRAAPKTFVLRRGNCEAPGEEVQPGFLSILNPAPTKIVAPKNISSTGRRTALANLLVNPENPLTARVMVNRIWHYHFGRGIVGTPSDFGIKGEPPTNPALLDWLASEFVRNGWSIKKMHRLIMNSSTYQQASTSNELAAKTDPENKLLWHFPRQRLEGEAIRDSALAVSGLLNEKIGGPSVFAEIPAGLSVTGGWPLSEEAERNRRSVYIFVRRNTRYPMFDAFDAPDTHESCPRRNVTTSPIQALTLLNSESSLKWAQNFAGRVLKMAGADESKQIETAFHLAFCRAPDNAEKEMAQKFFQRQRTILTERISAGEKIISPASDSHSAATMETTVLADLCHMLLNANEFVYRN